MCVQEEWGLTEAEEKAEEKRRKEFRQSLIPNTGSQLRVLAEQYQVMSGSHGEYTRLLEHLFSE